MKKRVCIIVLDSVGIGELPDAADFGDQGSHTLGHVFDMAESIQIPHLLAMGIGNITGSQLPAVANPTAAFGRLAEKTRAKDTTSGHWEIAGLIMDTPFQSYMQGFPSDLIEAFEQAIGRKILGNTAVSGTEIIKQYGEKHMATGNPIVYTSADSVFQIAAHENVIPLQELYQMCEIAYQITRPYGIGRIIARPFKGIPGQFQRTENRRDYSVPPVSETILDAISKSGQTVYGIGKIEDIFCHRGLTDTNHTTNNHDGIEATLQALTQVENGLIFTNLVDFDMLYGHRNDVNGYARALSEFDKRLPEILAAMRPEDLLLITADHGCDPSTPSTDHSREYIPILAYGQNIMPVDLKTRSTFADIAATAMEYLGLPAWSTGESFLPLLTPSPKPAPSSL